LKSKVSDLEDLVVKEQQDVLLERQEHETNLKKVMVQSFDKEQIITLNVGGTTFSTQHKTLMSVPSLLKAMFSGRLELFPLEDGSYFIDRDPKLFRYIINYLRSGVVTWPSNEKQKKMIMEEFDFFNIEFNRRISGSREFTYGSEFDKQGILYFLATEGGKNDWVNPRTKGVVEIYGESGYYRIENNSATRYNTQEDFNLAFDYSANPIACLTSPTDNMHFIINIMNRKVKLNTITVANSYSPETYLKGLKFSGSDSKTGAWVLLPEVEKGGSSAKVKTWTITTEQYFQYFKISSDHQVLISGLEMYGSLEDIS